MHRSGVLILVIALVFIGFVFFSLFRSEPVKVSGARLVRSGDQVSVLGEVSNSGDDSGPLRLEVRYYDREGRTVGSDVISIDSLRPGASSKFRSPPRTDRGVANFSIYLNHGRNPYGD
jgi:hypothetical protein